MISDKRIHSFRFPAEFEKQEAVWLGWPVYEIKKGMSSVPVFLRLIKVLTLHVRVKIAAQNEEQKRGIQNLLYRKGISLNNVDIYEFSMSGMRYNSGH